MGTCTARLRPGRLLPSGSAALLIALAATLASLTLGAPSAQAQCANEAIRQGQVSTAFPDGATALPDCMALELVTPAKKFNQYAISPGLAASDQRVRFKSVAALAETPKQGSTFDAYISTRTSQGWVTQAVAPPPHIEGGSNSTSLPCSFSPDLSRWAQWGSTSTQSRLGITTALGGGLDKELLPLSPTLAPTTTTVNEFAVNLGRCEGASADASRLLFSIEGAAYLPGDPVPSEKGLDVDYNVYLAGIEDGTPSVRLLARDLNGTVHGERCAAHIGSSATSAPASALITVIAYRGTVSPDASRIYFTTRPDQPQGSPCDLGANKLRIMERLETPSGPQIEELIASECDRVSPPCSAKDGDDVFLGASQEGGRVYFATTRQLADSDLDATADLYLFDAGRPEGERLTQASAGESGAPTPGEGAEVLGLADFAGDGTRAYFVAKGVLSLAANEEGDTAQVGEPNLYLYQRDAAHPAGRTVFIGTLTAADRKTWNGVDPTKQGASPLGHDAQAAPLLGPDKEELGIGGNGRILVFRSTAPLTADDADGGKSDEYRYDSDTGALERVSKAAPGGSDDGPFDLGLRQVRYEAGAQAPLAFDRWISEDGETIVFTTAEALSPSDTDGGASVYLWHDGELTAIPNAETPSVSLSGEQIAFVTPDPLLSEDGDSAKDVYIARVGGGFPPPPQVESCAGEACQGAPSAQPLAIGSASDSFTGPGNPARPPKCRKGFVRKRGACLRKARQRKQGQQRKRPRHRGQQGGSR